MCQTKLIHLKRRDIYTFDFSSFSGSRHPFVLCVAHVTFATTKVIPLCFEGGVNTFRLITDGIVGEASFHADFYMS